MSHLWNAGILPLVLGGCALWSASGWESVVTGIVSDAESAMPVAGAEVVIVERGLRTWSDAEGRYSIEGLRGGDWTIAAFADECRLAAATIRVGKDEQRRVNIELVREDPAEFRQRFQAAATRRDGAAIRVIEAKDLEDVPVRSLADFMALRFPEMVETAGGRPGAAARFRGRTRTASGERLDPVVRVDDVVVAGGGRGDRGAMEALRSLHVREIERIEVLRGPAAAAMYGTGAVGGVIDITTREGSAARSTEITAPRC